MWVFGWTGAQLGAMCELGLSVHTWLSTAICALPARLLGQDIPNTTVKPARIHRNMTDTVPRFVLCLRGRPIRRPNNAAAASKRAHCQPARRRPFIRRGPIITHDYPLFQSNQLAGVHRQQEITFCCCSRCMAGCLWGRDPVHKWLQVVRSPVRIPTRSASFCADR